MRRRSFPAIWRRLSPVRRSWVQSMRPGGIELLLRSTARAFERLGLVEDLGRSIPPHGTCTCCVTPRGAAFAAWAKGRRLYG